MRISRRKLDSGSAATLILLAMGGVSIATLGLGLGLEIARTDVRVQAIADLSALAAADSLAGIIAGYPCENAEEIAAKNGANLISCRIVSSVASVRVGKEHQLGSISKDARARPADAVN